MELAGSIYHVQYMAQNEIDILAAEKVKNLQTIATLKKENDSLSFKNVRGIHLQIGNGVTY